MQHARGLTFLLSPLLQATFSAIPSPLLADSGPAELCLDTSSALKRFINNRSPVTPGAAYARSTLGGLSVSQSTSTAAIIVPPWGLRLAVLCSGKATCDKALSLLLTTPLGVSRRPLGDRSVPPLPLYLVARLTCAGISSSCSCTDGSERSVWDCSVQTTAAYFLTSDPMSLSRPQQSCLPYWNLCSWTVSRAGTQQWPACRPSQR